ncbi:hypothetical protein BURMUCF2_3227 [Burkholderia multivorans CF2]|nr:hypothetical protein BURMUCF2_3227 [Burkholderia multivorans CF2]
MKAKIKPIELWRGNRTRLELRGDKSGMTANGTVCDRNRPAREARSGEQCGAAALDGAGGFDARGVAASRERAGGVTLRDCRHRRPA